MQKALAATGLALFIVVQLNAGSVPLDILERQIDDYIRRVGQAAL